MTLHLERLLADIPELWRARETVRCWMERCTYAVEPAAACVVTVHGECARMRVPGAGS